MKTEISKIQANVSNLYEQFNQGIYYDDLFDRFFALQTEIEIKEPTQVRLPRLNSSERQHFFELTSNLQFAEGKISDEDLAFLLKYIGNRDPKIRDTGVYFTLLSLFKNQQITNEQVVWLKNYLLQDDVLFFHILEPENDGVFTRSFAVLFLSLVIDQDQANFHVLELSDYEEIQERMATYILLEQDGRGFVAEKGWAHVYSHLGGFFQGFIKEDIPRSGKMFLFNILLFGYLQSKDSLAFGEDRVIAGSILSLMQRDTVYVDYVLEVFRFWNDLFKDMNPPNDVASWTRYYNQLRLFDTMANFENLPRPIKGFINRELR